MADAEMDEANRMFLESQRRAVESPGFGEVPEGPGAAPCVLVTVEEIERLRRLEGRLLRELARARKLAGVYEERERQYETDGLRAIAEDYSRLLLRTWDKIDDLELWLGLKDETWGMASDLEEE